MQEKDDAFQSAGLPLFELEASRQPERARYERHGDPQPGLLKNFLLGKPYEEEESRLTSLVPTPTKDEQRALLAARAAVSPELVEMVDRVNTRRDHRVEKLLLDLLREEADEARTIVKKLANERVPVVMPPPGYDTPGMIAAVGKFAIFGEDGPSVDGLYLELSPHIKKPYLPVFRNELYHVRVNSDVARKVSDGRGFPLSVQETRRLLEKTHTLDDEIASSVAQVTSPGEKISFRDFYQRTAAFIKNLNGTLKDPESYFAVNYGYISDEQHPSGIRIRELLLTYINPGIEEKELRAFEKFVSTLAEAGRDSAAEEDLELALKRLLTRLDNTNPSRSPNFYYE